MTYVKLSSVSLERPHRFRVKDSDSQRMPFSSPYILRNINFSVSKGTRLGILGENGAGKSSLLKVIGGNLFPSSGNVEVIGSIARLWSLSSGFDPRMSARENVRLYGILRGLPRDDVEFRMRNIEEFVDLGPYFDKPFTTLSNGMISRVLFTLATEWPADIILIDEGIPFADEAFHLRAKHRMNNFLSRSSILIMASHSKAYLETFCDSHIRLKQGEIV